MSIEMTRLLMESVLVFVRAMEVTAVGLTGLGWCLLVVVIARTARRTLGSPSFQLASSPAEYTMDFPEQVATTPDVCHAQAGGSGVLAKRETRIEGLADELQRLAARVRILTAPSRTDATSSIERSVS